MKLIKLSPIVLSLVFMFGAANYVSAQVVDDPNAKACEELADEHKKALIKIAGLEAENKFLKEASTLKDDKIALVSERADFYKKAYESSAKIDTNSGLIIENLRTQVAEYRMELLELRNENKSLRRNSWIKTAAGFGAGFGLGLYTGNK